MKLPEVRLNPVRVAEAVPSILFLLLWRTGQDAQMTGWIGCGLAALLIVGFLVLRQRFHPIMLGINIHLLLAAPLITAAFELQGPDAGNFLIRYAETGVLVMVFLTGLGLTIFSKGGFLGEPEVPWHINWRFSLLMLICAAGSLPLSIQLQDRIAFLAVAGPLILLFILRNYLAGLAQRTGGGKPDS
jgi:hypothetical protein